MLKSCQLKLFHHHSHFGDIFQGIVILVLNSSATSFGKLVFFKWIQTGTILIQTSSSRIVNGFDCKSHICRTKVWFQHAFLHICIVDKTRQFRNEVFNFVFKYSWLLMVRQCIAIFILQLNYLKLLKQRKHYI